MALAPIQPAKEDLHEAAWEPHHPAFSAVVRDPGKQPDPLASFEFELQPRTPHTPMTLRMPPGKQMRLSVKFMDWAMARSSGDNQLELSYATSEQVRELVTLAREHDLVFTPAYGAPEKLDAMRIRAARNSRAMQPDFNGTMKIDLPSTSAVLQVAQSLQSMSLIEYVGILSLDQPPPPPNDIAPTTPDFEDQQGYLDTNPGYGIEFLKDLGADGSGIRLSNCEYSYNPDHEDLVGANLRNSGGDIDPDRATDHGTATFGMIMAQDNGYGVTGIAPACEGHFYETLIHRDEGVALALGDSKAGDIVLLEMQSYADPRRSSERETDYVPEEYRREIWELCKSATESGIIVVAAAGNGSNNLDDSRFNEYMSWGDSGAIIVGGGSNTTAHSKRYSSNYGSRVDVQAWGTQVVTTGYGDYAWEGYDGDDNQKYTQTYSGSSSASAGVAGAAVLLQSFAKNQLGTLFTPEEMRTLLKTYSHLQDVNDVGNIGPAIALDLVGQELVNRMVRMEFSRKGSTDVLLRFAGLQYSTYKVETSTDLIEWTHFFNLPSSAEEITAVLVDELEDHPKRFYRLTRVEDQGEE